MSLSNIRLEDNRIFIKAAKNGISGEYFLTKEAKRHLSAYLKIRNQKKVLSDALFLSRKLGHLTTTQIRRLYYKYAEKGGLDKSKSHPLCHRHSIVVHMADGGTPWFIYQITSKKRHEIQARALDGETGG